MGREKPRSMAAPKNQIRIRPVTYKEWKDLETLFSEHGVQNGCWCMYWRIPRQQCQRNYGEGNKQALREIIEKGIVPGILAYHADKPIGWCSVAPREHFPVILRSPTLKPVDDQSVWSIVCFFISRPYRRNSLTRLLIDEAIKYARRNGARIIEAYPIDVEAKYLDVERYAGLTTTFSKAGFKEVMRRSERKPIMRYYIKE